MFVFYFRIPPIWLPLISNHCSDSVFEKKCIFGELSEPFSNTCHNIVITLNILEEMKLHVTWKYIYYKVFKIVTFEKNVITVKCQVLKA